MIQELRFEGRNLKPFAEPVAAVKLSEGHVYFMVNYSDEEMTIPHVEPLVFIGRLDPQDESLMFFQDCDSYMAGVRYQDSTEDTEATFHKSSQVKHIFEFDQALNSLLLCSLRRGAERTPG